AVTEFCPVKLRCRNPPSTGFPPGGGFLGAVLPVCSFPPNSGGAVVVCPPRPATLVSPPFASGKARTPRSPIAASPPFFSEAEPRTGSDVLRPGSGTDFFGLDATMISPLSASPAATRRKRQTTNRTLLLPFTHGLLQLRHNLAAAADVELAATGQRDPHMRIFYPRPLSSAESSRDMMNAKRLVLVGHGLLIELIF